MAISDLEWAIGFWRDRCDAYDIYSAYYDGDHDLSFATEKFRNVFGNLFQRLADNLCPVVVDVPSDRLRIDGWDGTSASAAQTLWDDPLVALPRVLNQAWRDAAKVGDAYVLVWPDEDPESDTFGQAHFWPHDADQMCVRYSEDDPGRVEVAAKQWLRVDGFGRINLYYQDGAIEKWVTRGKCRSGMLPNDMRRWLRLNEDLSGPDVEGEYGMPVFHFGHAADIGDYGVSVLKNIIPMQDALNKSICDLMVDMEFTAFPQRWATGLMIETDEAGRVKDKPFTPGVDRVWTGGDNVKYGDFAVGDMRQFIDVQESFRAEIARISGVPTHYLNLDAIIPTGEGLRVSESRLISGIKNDQDTYQAQVVRCMMHALKINGQGGDKPSFKPVWADPNPHNPMLDAETVLVKQQVGVSTKQGLRELRYTDAEITEMVKDDEAEQQRKMAQRQAAFGGNGGKGTPGVPALPGEVRGVSGRPANGQNTAAAFQRNGSPGQASRPAARQQQRRRPVQ